MSQRYGPPPPPLPRDRSPPPRHFDRRPSASYSTTQLPPDRAPPRGPKADNFRGGYHPSSSSSSTTTPRPRGGFTARPVDGWSRERDLDRDRDWDRDSRNTTPAYRRDDDRADWARRDREFPARDRPNTVDRRDSVRERSASPERPRRNSRESIVSNYGRPSDTPASTYYTPSTRGGSVRGRGRGDWDRSRGRSSFIGERERDGFYPRSRSRDGRREREYDRGRPADDLPGRPDRFERRDYDRGDDRDARPREHEMWQRDRSPARSITGRPVSPGAMSNMSHSASERPKADYDPARKPATGPLSARSEGRREPDSDYFGSRTDPARREAPASTTFSQPSSTQGASAGLDYGPPPSVPAPTLTNAERPASNRPPAPRLEPTTIVQPPSAPKAERVAIPATAPPTSRSSTQQFDQWSTQRQSQPAHASPVGSDPAAKTSKTSPDLDRTILANAPSGPRGMSGSSYKPRVQEQPSLTAPLNAPRQPKAIETRPIPGAPTGPRSAGFAGAGGSQSNASRTWATPEFRPKGPSIMNQLAKPYAAEPRDRSSYISGSRPSITQSTQSRSKSLTGSDTAALSPPVKAEHPQAMNDDEDEDMADAALDVGLSMPGSDDDVEDDDAFDEDYFAASEESHAREMKLLEARKPPSILQDPVTAALLIRVQLLNMIIQGLVPDTDEEVRERSNSAGAMDLDLKPGAGPLSPQRSPEKEADEEELRPKGRPLSKPFVNPIPTPPIDDLPYLNRAVQNLSMAEGAQGTSTFVFPDVEDEEHQQRMRATLEQDLERQNWDEEGTLDLLRGFFMERYPKWREDTEIHEKRLREVHQPSPAPASPAPSATPSLPTGPERSGAERTRGARNTTDLDMQQAILMSQQSAKEEEERREKEAASNALPNYDTEAVVPFMLRTPEVDTDLFEDTTQRISQVLALDFMAFIPPEDDFTNEEQLSFIAAFCQNPKKWGKIADAIPGRTFQDCITHYYLTKDQANYKEHWRRSQPKRKRGRQAVKPRANNLMSDLALNEDKEGTPAAVTDSGRPRRAAAPTFGDSNDTDSATNGGTVKRGASGAKDGADAPATKPGRGRRAGVAAKTRKTKDKAITEQGPNAGPMSTEASPQKGTSASKDKGRTLLKAESTPKLDALNSPVLPATLAIDPLHTTHADINQPAGPAPAVAVTSYWSVPEMQKLPLLVQYYGRDFGAIAAFLKSKSSTMIKNYFQRRLNEGKVELEQWADLVEAKKARGEPFGPPPTPIQPPKRRYEATPSMANVGRAPIGGSESMHHEVESLPQSTKQLVEDFPPNSIQRNATGEVVAKPRPPRELLQQSQQPLHMQPKVEDHMRSDRPILLQKPAMQGPPRGYFQDEPVGYQPRIHRPQENPQPQQHISQFEARGSEIPQQQFSQQGLGPSAVQQSREQLIQPQLAQSPPFSLHRNDRGHPGASRGHGRENSMATSIQSGVDAAGGDPNTIRGVGEQPRSLLYPGHPGSASVPIGPSGQQPQRNEPPRNVPDPPKSQPAKRSTVFSILNDDTPEPPAKRASTESAKRSINTPPPVPASLSGQQSLLQPSRHMDEFRDGRSVAPYSHVPRYGALGQDYPAGHSSSPAPGPVTDLLDKYDPHQQNQSHESRSMHQSPAMSPYSVIPPSSRADSSAPIPGRFESRGLDQAPHRRTYLGTTSAPSPPPQLPASVQPHRSLSSGSTQHGRGSSLAYPPQQQQTQPPPAATTAGYPPATSSTPISAMHRTQASIEYPGQRRLTIQEHIREQQQQPREHDVIGQRRDVDILQHSQPSSQRPVPNDRRDFYGGEPVHSGAQLHQPPPPSQTPQPQHVGMGYATQPPRTYTPPHGTYGSSSDQRGHHSLHQPQPIQPQQRQQTLAQPSYGGPSSHHQLGRSLGTDPRNHPGPPPSQQPPQHQHHHHQQQQQQGPPPNTHYRGYGQSQDDRR